MTTGTPKLARGIGPVGLLFSAIGAIIGSGWLFAGLYAAEAAGPAAIFSWVLAAVLLAIIAMPFAELGAALRAPGGCTRYAHAAFGGFASFIAGWLSWLGYVVIPTVETIAILEYLGDPLPWLVEVQDGNRSLSVAGSFIAALLLLTMVVVNLLGVRWLSRSNGLLTAWKLVVPALTAAVLVAYGFQGDNFTVHGFAPNGVDGVLAGLASGGVLYSLLGYRVVVDLAGEARRPQRDIPIAIFGALGICALLFIFVQVAFIGAVPSDQLAQGWGGIVSVGRSGPFAAFALTLGLGWLATVLYVDATISPYGCGLIFTGANSRLLLAMGRNGVLPRAVGRLSRTGVPWVAILLNFLVGLILLLPLPAWNELSAIVAGITMITSGIGAIAFLRLRRTHPDLERPFRVPGGTIVGVAAFVCCTLATYWCGWPVLRTSVIGLAFGLALFATLHIRRSDPDPASVLRPRAAAWIVVWIVGIAVLTWLGDTRVGADFLPTPLGDVVVVAWALLICPFAIASGLDRSTADAVLDSIHAEVGETA